MATRKPAKKAGRKAAHKAPATVQCLINGQPSGVITPGEMTIAEAANQLARNNGLKSYSILVNGTKVDVAGAARRLAGATSLEVFAKETRG